MLSLWCEYELLNVKDPPCAPRFYKAHGGIKTSLEPMALPSLFPRALPLRPIWLGFTINTLFYAAVLWLLIPGPFALRRLIRRKRGFCPDCGYDLRHADHDTCPECGAALLSAMRNLRPR